MAWRNIYKNFVVGNYGGTKLIDNDDGSLFYKNNHNFMIYGIGQKGKGGALQNFGNMIVYID